MILCRPMNQQTKDAFLLSTWAGPGVTNPQHGYDYLISTRQLTKRAVTKLVHEALTRAGYDPHTSPTLIAAWLKLHRGFITRGILSERGFEDTLPILSSTPLLVFCVQSLLEATGQEPKTKGGPCKNYLRNQNIQSRYPFKTT